MLDSSSYSDRTSTNPIVNYWVDRENGVAWVPESGFRNSYAFSCAWLYSFKTTPPNAPTYSTLSADKIIIGLNEEITFTASSDCATGFVIGIDSWKDNTLERVVTKPMENNQFECKFDKPGNYSAYVTVYNEIGGIDSKNIFFTVTDTKPATSKLDSSTKKIVSGEEIEFFASSDLANTYLIEIDHNKKRYMTECMENGIFKCSFDEPGEYTAYVTSSNKYGGVDSESITFRVYKTEEEKIYNGDCNMDGKINSIDLVLTQKYMFGVEEIEDLQAIELSKDGEIYIIDFIMLKNMLIS